MVPDQNIQGELLAAEEKNARFRRATHDLSNLLGVILGNVDLALSDVPADHAAVESLREIQQAARDARTICRQMRDSLHEKAPQSAPHLVAAVAKHFLVIDDDAAFRSLFERSVLRSGHKVCTFSTPWEALEVFQGNPGEYDVVITDLNMPGSNGMEVASMFLERSPHLCVCLTSGGLSEAIIAEARAAGVRHVIPKPGTGEEMNGAILRLVEDVA